MSDKPKLKIGFNFVPLPRAIWDENLKLTLGEFRLLGYLIRHQVSFGNTNVRLSDEELLHGRKKRGGARMDSGCGIQGRNNLKVAREALIKRGWIVMDEDLSDKARPRRWYRVNVEAETEAKSEVSESDSGVSDLDSSLSGADSRTYRRGLEGEDIKAKDWDTSRAESENGSENDKRGVSIFSNSTEHLGQPDVSVPIGTSSTVPEGAGSAEPSASASLSPEAQAGAARETHGSGQTGMPVAKIQDHIKRDRKLDADPPTGTSREAVALVRALATASDTLYPRCRFPVSPEDYGFAERRVEECPNLDPVAEAGKFLNQFKGRVIRGDYQSRMLIRFSDFSIWLREQFRGRFKADPIELRKVVFH